VKVFFDLSAGLIRIEGEGDDLVKVFQAARELAPSMDIHITGTAGIAGEKRPSQPPVQQSPQNGNGPSGLTLKQFIKSLHLQNTAERIAAIAYHEKHHENRESFSPKEMGSWFTIAGLQKPNQMAVAVFDAKKRYGYLDSAGHGKWKLTPNGENLVVGKQNSAENDS
jgi:hypothetical protein